MTGYITLSTQRNKHYNNLKIYNPGTYAPNFWQRIRNTIWDVKRINFVSLCFIKTWTVGRNDYWSKFTSNLILAEYSTRINFYFINWLQLWLQEILLQINNQLNFILDFHLLKSPCSLPGCLFYFFQPSSSRKIFIYKYCNCYHLSVSLDKIMTYLDTVKLVYSIISS